MKPDVNLESMQSGPTLPPKLPVLVSGEEMECSQPAEVSHWEPGKAPGRGRARLGLPLHLLFLFLAQCLLFLSSLPPPSLLLFFLLSQFLRGSYPWMCLGLWSPSTRILSIAEAAAGT